MISKFESEEVKPKKKITASIDFESKIVSLSFSDTVQIVSLVVCLKMYKRDGTHDFYLVKGITDFRCGINRLSEIIRDKQTVNVFDNAGFIFTCKINRGSQVHHNWYLLL